MSDVRLCKTEECANPARSRGLCEACYQRFRRREKTGRDFPRVIREHLLSEIDASAMTAICAGCGPGTEIYLKQATYACKPARRARDRERRQRLLAERRAALLDACEICGATENLCWDHNHGTGAFRGTLCDACNTGIGLLKDDPEVIMQASAYLEGAVWKAG